MSIIPAVLSSYIWVFAISPRAIQCRWFVSACTMPNGLESHTDGYSPDERNENTLIVFADFALHEYYSALEFFQGFVYFLTDSKTSHYLHSKEEFEMNQKTVRLAKMGMLVAVSIVLVYFVHFPIFPAVAFLEYDPADIPILMGTFAFGPLAGVLLTVVTSIIQGVTVSAASGAYGIIMHIIATSVLVIVAGVIYKKNKSRKGAVIGLLLGVLAMTVVMIGANLVITPLFMGVPRNIVWDLMPFIAGFNAIKAGINGLVTFILYKRISGFLHK